jgi:ligand-binding sensor domain-containing protein
MLARFFLPIGLLVSAVFGAPRWLLMDLQRLAAEEVVAMAQDDLGNKYFGTRKGLTAVTKSGDFRIFTREKTQHGLGSDSITCLGVDRYRGLWVGTDGGGISLFANGAWTRYTRESTSGGLPDDGVLALAIYREERWVATRNGFAVLRGGVWTTYTGDQISGRLPNRVATSIAVDSSGNKWIGTIGGLVRFTGSTWSKHTRGNTDGALPHNGITYLLVDQRGALWVGTQAGVARRDRSGKWRNFSPDPGLGEMASELTYSLSAAFSGEVWACLRGGAARYAGGEWETFTKNNTSGLLTRYVYHVMPEPGGTVWFATAKGVASMTPAEEED